MNNDETDSRGKVSIPSWVIPLVRAAGTLVIGLSIGYAKFIALENKVAENGQRAVEIKAAITANEAITTSLDRRLSLAEMNQSRSEKEMGESLVRIESQLKELRNDVKDLEKKVK